MKNYIVQILAILILSACQNKSSNSSSISKAIESCTNKQLLCVLDQKSKDYDYLSKHFKIDKEQYVYFYDGEDKQLSNWMRESLLNKFTDKIIDSTYIKTECSHNSDEFITVGDLALYCLAKTELLPFALATGSQNCTEPYISSKITLPINFYKYTQFDRIRIQNRYQKYLKSDERIEYLKDQGYK